jgi:hypothetical protein
MALIDWDDLDHGDMLNGQQRHAVDLAYALLTATGRDKEKSLIMLDMLATIMLYGIFGSRADAAAVTHADHIMETVDIIEARFASLARRLQ